MAHPEDQHSIFTIPFIEIQNPEDLQFYHPSMTEGRLSQSDLINFFVRISKYNSKLESFCKFMISLYFLCFICLSINDYDQGNTMLLVLLAPICIDMFASGLMPVLFICKRYQSEDQVIAQENAVLNSRGLNWMYIRGYLTLELSYKRDRQINNY